MIVETKKNVTKKKNAGKPATKTSKQTFKKADAVGPYFEYIMTRTQAEESIKDSLGNVCKEAKGRENEYLVDYVNEQYNLRGTCVVVTVR